MDEAFKFKVASTAKKVDKFIMDHKVDTVDEDGDPAVENTIGAGLFWAGTIGFFLGGPIALPAIGSFAWGILNTYTAIRNKK
jgi:hypothetical protein